MGQKTPKRDPVSIFHRLRRYWADSRRTRIELQKGPRTLAEALRDSGALTPPRGGDRLTFHGGDL